MTDVDWNYPKEELPDNREKVLAIYCKDDEYVMDMLSYISSFDTAQFHLEPGWYKLPIKTIGDKELSFIKEKIILWTHLPNIPFIEAKNNPDKSPCPFCGCKDVTLGGFEAMGNFNIRCDECDARSPMTRGQKDCIEKWNKIKWNE